MEITSPASDMPANAPRPAPLARAYSNCAPFHSACFGGAEPVSDPPCTGGCIVLSLEGGAEAGVPEDGAIGDAASGVGFAVESELDG
ncbi:MAG: hypothetical protein WBP86_13105 [Thiobacillaceae bacterium]